MVDLIWGSLLIASLAIGVFLLTRRATRSLAPHTCNLLAVLVVLVIVLYVRDYWYDARFARWLPFANLIVLGNGLPILAVALAALAWDHLPACRWRRVLSTSALVLVGAYTLIAPILGRPPACGDQWDSFGVCKQTTDFTCSPAAAATLLRLHGIESNEREMAELCLTRQGTSWPGLYRGLKLKTAGTPWDVEVLNISADQLPQQSPEPMILSVGLDRNARVDANFSQEYGWQPGVNHSVVLLGYQRGRAKIADPSQPYSVEQWDASTLRLLWRGLAIRLVKRPQS